VAREREGRTHQTIVRALREPGALAAAVASGCAVCSLCIWAG